MDLTGLLNMGGGSAPTSKEFGRSQASTTFGDVSYGASDARPAWLWPAVALAGLAILAVVLIKALK